MNTLILESDKWQQISTVVMLEYLTIKGVSY